MMRLADLLDDLTPAYDATAEVDMDRRDGIVRTWTLRDDGDHWLIARVRDDEGERRRTVWRDRPLAAVLRGLGVEHGDVVEIVVRRPGADGGRTRRGP